jgi:hypothetical protein
MGKNYKQIKIFPFVYQDYGINITLAITSVIKLSAEDPKKLLPSF